MRMSESEKRKREADLGCVCVCVFPEIFYFFFNKEKGGEELGRCGGFGKNCREEKETSIFSPI